MKSFFLPILFLFLMTTTIISCEADSIDEELQQIDQEEVEDPDDRGN
ncbi:hypothetical protein [Aquimarina sp. SS2-1]